MPIGVNFAVTALLGGNALQNSHASKTKNAILLVRLYFVHPIRVQRTQKEMAQLKSR